MVITLQDQRLLDWAGAKLHCRWGAEAKTIASVDDGEILAVCVFDDFTKHNCTMHIASTTPRWGTASFIKACFRYPFIQCGLERVTFIVRADDPKIISLAERLGAQKEGRVRRYFSSCDALIYGMTWEDADRWIGEKHGQRFAFAAACA